MKENKEKYQNLLNHVLKKEYPFIERIQVIRLREIFSELQLDINLIVDIDFIEDHLDRECYDQMDELFFSLFSFNMCSDIKIDERKLNSDLLTLYKMLILPNQTLYNANASISIIGAE